MPLALAPPPAEPPTRWTWARGALALWAFACLGIAGYAYLKPRSASVYPVYEFAGRAWCAGADMYGPTGGLPDAPPDLYRYSPAFAVLTVPFAALPSGAGNAAWKLANAAVYAAGLWAFGTYVLPWRTTRDRVARLFVLGLAGALSSFFNGQANLMMTGFMLVALAAVARDRWWLAAGFLAAAALVKLFPLALALTLCVVYRRKLPVRFAVALAAGLALPLAAQDPAYAWGQTAEWVRHLAASAEIAPRLGHRSLDTMFELTGFAVSQGAFRVMGVAAGAVVLAVALAADRRGDRRAALTTAAGWYLSWAVLFFPSSENATFSILAPVLAWAVLSAFERPGARVERAWLLAAVYLVGLSTSDAGGPFRVFFDAYNAATVGAMMFQAWLVADLVRGRPRLRVAAAPAPDAPATASRRAA